LHESLGVLAARGQFGVPRLRAARPEQLSATLPHQVYVLGLDDAANGEFARAQPSGWRYLLEADREVVASAETRLEGDDQHTFSHINEGPFVRGTVRALAVADRAATEQEHALEFAVLHVPALYLMSVWLRPDAQAKSDSLFIPIAPAPTGIEANEVYTSEVFASLVADLARGVPRASVDDPTGGA
jgi:hypothetical protein